MYYFSIIHTHTTCAISWDMLVCWMEDARLEGDDTSEVEAYTQVLLHGSATTTKHPTTDEVHSNGYVS